MAKTKTYILLFLIVALGLFLRVYNIENAPPGVYPDEAVNGIDAMGALEHGDWQWFYPANNGREGMFMNLIAVCFYLFGVSPLTLKLPSIIFGTLTIVGTYFLAKELFNRRVGLISAFLVSTGFWAINFSRISFRANMLPFVLVWSFYFLWKGLRDKKYVSFILGGLFFGLGIHTYIAWRIAPAILIAIFPILWITRENFLKNYWKQLLAFSFSVLLSAAPMLYTFLVSHPEYLESRSASISIMSAEVNQGDLAGTFLRSFGLSLVKYNFWGDQNWRHNYPPYAILDPITGIAFTTGLIYSIGRLFRLLYLRFRKGEYHPRLEVYFFLSAWFFLMLAPEFLTAEGNPHSLRAIGTLPVVFIFSALVFEYLFRASRKSSWVFQKITLILVMTIFLLIGTFNSLKYHFFWAKNPETARAFDKNLMALSGHLQEMPTNREKFVVAESMQRIPIQLFNWEDPSISYIYPGEISQLEPRTINNFTVLLTDRNDYVINYLQEKFPRLELEEKKDEFGLSFYVLE